MKKMKLHSKLIELQGETISTLESTGFLSCLRKVTTSLNLGQLSPAEAGLQIRKAALKIADDLHLNGIALSSGSDESFVEFLPKLFKA